MAQYDPALLQALPEGVILACGGIVTSLNPAAAALFPGLRSGMPLPGLLQGGAPAGTLTLGGREFRLTASASGREQLFLLHPVPEQSSLPASDGLLRQLRALTGELLAELGPRTDPASEDFLGGDVLKTFHRLFRLVDNADRLAGGLSGFRPVTLDLAGLCRRLTDEAARLLRTVGVTLRFECALPSLLISGDGDLLRHMLLELIANSAKFAPGGEILVTLSRIPSGALLSVSDSGGEDGVRQLTRAMLEGVGDAPIPRPGQGAGLGLAAARQTAALHGGSLLADCSGPAPRVVVSLAAGRITSGAAVRTPVLCTDGGFDPALLALSDVLPADIFALDGMD